MLPGGLIIRSDARFTLVDQRWQTLAGSSSDEFTRWTAGPWNRPDNRIRSESACSFCAPRQIVRSLAEPDVARHFQAPSQQLRYAAPSSIPHSEPTIARVGLCHRSSAGSLVLPRRAVGADCGSCLADPRFSPRSKPRRTLAITGTRCGPAFLLQYNMNV